MMKGISPGGSGRRREGGRWAVGIRWAVGLVLFAVGVLLTIGGAALVAAGGSAYYVVAGAVCLVASILLLRGRPAGLLLYALFLLATIGWAIWEVSLDFWQLLPRICGPAIVGLVLLAVPLERRADASARLARGAVTATSVLGLVLLAATWLGSMPRPPAGSPARAAASPAANTTAGTAANPGADWPAYGGDMAGTRHSAAAQITPANVDRLERAWTFRTGDTNAKHPELKGRISFMVTPLMADGKLFFCSPLGVVFALDPDTGRQIWKRDPKADPGNAQMFSCRGVSYHSSGEEEGLCASRILSTTVDGRLLATDAATGVPCPAFGANGDVSLTQGMGTIDQLRSYTTSPPTIIGDIAVLGAYVRDNFSSEDPSGVVRAFNVLTGDLVWSWDSGRGPDAQVLREGESWTPASPNAWSVFSADPALGLVYLPTGNATPDHVGTHRSPELERYASSIVALDARTGIPRWHFQTTHHDLWDYDVPAQPPLFDMPVGGTIVPAVAAVTKRGEIFILDRRTGAPLHEVEERPAPRGTVPGERYAPTQPYAAGFPSFAPPPLTEAAMWGATPLDQLWCRLRFRSLDYAGEFTPPSERGAIQWPGIFGVLNWGSVSIDAGRGLMIVNGSAIPQEVRLFPRGTDGGKAAASAHEPGYLPQAGTDYGVSLLPMVSPLGFPCQAPPWGFIAAVDLAKREVAWTRPFGTTEDMAPLGIAVPGMFNLGGAVSTASGVTFIGAALDDYLRAIDTATGRELWRGRLPAGGQATPMTYLSPRTGRQYVVIAAGGHGFMGSTLGDHVVAFALPEKD